MNRAALGDKFGKRPSDATSQNRKMQRNFHINKEEVSEYQEILEKTDEEYEQAFDDYMENISDTDDIDQYNISEIYFLG